MKLELGRAAEFMKGSAQCDLHAIASGYSIDSRTVAPDDLFFAIEGEKNDGHDYVAAALNKGAVAAVVNRTKLGALLGLRDLIAVDDTTIALQRLGAAVRRLWGKQLVGVTGSTGKTTTKECIAHVLGSQKRVLKSLGNLNNHWGMPMQLLRLEAEHDIAVIEIGMSHAGEIKALAELAQPDVGVVTNVGPVHLEFFDSIAGIARAKYELIESLPAGGMAVLNADDEYVCQFGRDFHGRVIFFGIDKPADISAENIRNEGLCGMTFDVVGPGFRECATMPLLGRHNVLNALAAVAVATERGIPPSTAVGSLSSLAATEKRGEILSLGGATVINDCYNSNPKALKTMVETLMALPAKRHLVIAGEMLELGPEGAKLHRELGEFMAHSKVDFVLGVRGVACEVAEGAAHGGSAALFVNTPEEAGEWLARELKAGDAVLLKGSRGVRLEKALEVLRAHLDETANR